MVLTQAKWYYYIILGLVDVEANFLGKCFKVIETVRVYSLASDCLFNYSPVTYL